MVSNLTDEQRAEWSAAIAGAEISASELSVGLASMVPFASTVVRVSAIDEYWRVALGPGFWRYPEREREAIVIHECLHVVCNHHARARIAHQSDAKTSNMAQDLEINQLITTLPRVHLPDDALMPGATLRVPRNRTMEEYYGILSDGDGDGAGGDSAESSASSSGDDSKQSPDAGGESDDDSRSDADGSQSTGGDGGQQDRGQGTQGGPGPCDGDRGMEVENEADALGIGKLDGTNQSFARQQVADDTRKSMAHGTGSMDGSFAARLLDGMKPPRVNWREVLTHAYSSEYSKAARRCIDYSYKRVNRRGTAFASDLVFPGLVGRSPRTMVAVDTSGSMGEKDYDAMLREVSALLKEVSHSEKNSIVFFCVDTKMKDPDLVTDIADIDLKGGGGTDMAPAFAYVSGLSRSKRPDVFVLVTDGGFDWSRLERSWPSGVKVIIALTSDMSLGSIPAFVSENATVVVIGDSTRR